MVLETLGSLAIQPPDVAAKPRILYWTFDVFPKVNYLSIPPQTWPKYITPRRRLLLEKLIVIRLLKTFLGFYEDRRFMNMFRKSIYWFTRSQSTNHTYHIHLNVILSSTPVISTWNSERISHLSQTRYFVRPPVS